MHINELLSEQTQLDELSLAGVGRGLGKAAGAVGGAVGGVQGAWQGMKDVYGQKKDRVAKVSQRNVQRAGGYRRTPPTQATQAGTNAAPAVGGTRPYVAPASAGTNTAAGPNPKQLRQQAAALTQQADEIEKSMSEPTADYSGGQTQAPAPSNVTYSGMPKSAPLPQATTAPGAYGVKNAYAPTTNAPDETPPVSAAEPSAPQVTPGQGQYSVTEPGSTLYTPKSGAYSVRPPTTTSPSPQGAYGVKSQYATAEGQTFRSNYLGIDL